MNIDSYFFRLSDAMPRKKNQAADDTDHSLQASSDHAGGSIVADISAGAGLLAFREVVVEITANISTIIDEKLSPLSELLRIHREELERHDKRLTEVEQRISMLEDATDPVDAKMKAQEKIVDELSERADDLENRGWRKNIRIVGLPEEVEGDDPTLFLETWLPEMKLERAHRSLAP